MRPDEPRLADRHGGERQPSAVEDSTPRRRCTLLTERRSCQGADDVPVTARRRNIDRRLPPPTWKPLRLFVLGGAGVMFDSLTCSCLRGAVLNTSLVPVRFPAKIARDRSAPHEVSSSTGNPRAARKGQQASHDRLEGKP